MKPIPRRILTFVLAVDVAWLLLYLLALATATHTPNLFFMMNLKAEGNPPTWWFGTQDMLVAITFLLLGSRLFASDSRVQPVRRLFLALGIGFACISADEVGQIHEKFAPMLEQNTAIKGGEEALMRALHVSHALHGGGLWMVVYLIIGIALMK